MVLEGYYIAPVYNEGQYADYGIETLVGELCLAKERKQGDYVDGGALAVLLPFRMDPVIGSSLMISLCLSLLCFAWPLIGLRTCNVANINGVNNFFICYLSRVDSNRKLVTSDR